MPVEAGQGQEVADARTVPVILAGLKIVQLRICDRLVHRTARHGPYSQASEKHESLRARITNCAE